VLAVAVSLFFTGAGLGTRVPRVSVVCPVGGISLPVDEVGNPGRIDYQ
jgi:hypothetical protein